MPQRRFGRHGAYFVPHGEHVWDDETTFVPSFEPADVPDAWHPEDALLVPMHHSDGHVLGKALVLSWRQRITNGFFLRPETFYNFASYLESVGSTFTAYGGESLHAKSHGEAFLSLFQHRFDDGFYVLDEPEAALSPQRQLAFLRILHQLGNSRVAQFVIATHSPLLLALPGATVLSLDDGAVKVAENVADLHSENNKLGKENSLTEKGAVVNGRGDTPNMHDIITGSQPDGTAFAAGEDHSCGNWAKNGEGSAQVGHHDRQGGGQNPTSWNAAHGSRGCSQQNLQGTGGNGLFYCFAIN